ncbi:MAG: M48 family metalloprotease [Anaerolineales bacterium]
MNNLRGSTAIRLLIGAIIAIGSVVSYFVSQQYNPITDEDQHISITRQQEIALGMESEPQLIQEFGGLAPDDTAQQRVDRIGTHLVNNSLADDTEWAFEFHVLDAPDMVNALALPGGPVFITTGMLSRLEGEDALAGVLAHEMAHILARHSAERIAQSDLTNGLVGAVAVASNEASAAQTAALVGQLINMDYSREDETQADTLGVCIMMEAGYDPQGLVQVMQVLAEISQENRQPEFLSTHPNPDNRIEDIRAAIDDAPDDCPEPES